ncbi:MAG: MFS transporter [DPANN group archaeon]|nr:MFS transporter [DPANN group archaeon]
MQLRTFEEKAKQLTKVFQASILSFIAILAFGVYDFILPIFTESKSASFAIVGLIVSLVYVASLLAEIPTGLVVDKFGRIKTLVVAMTAMSLMGIAYFFTKDIVLLAVLSLVFGIISVAFWIPSTVLIRDFSPHKMRCQAEGVYMSITQMGWILGPIIAGIIATLFSESYNFLLITGFMLAAVLFSLAIFRGKSVGQFREIEKGHKHKARLSLLSTIFKEYISVHRHALPLYILTLGAYVWIAIEWTFIPLAGMARFNLTAEGVGLLLGAMMAVEGLLYYSASYIMDKIGKKYIITAGFLLLFSSTYFMFLAGSIMPGHPLFHLSSALFVMFALLAAGGVSWILPGTEALLTEIVPANLYGEMSGVFDTSKDFGMIIGPLAGGLLVVPLANYLAPFLLVAVISGVSALISGWIFWPGKKKHGK